MRETIIAKLQEIAAHEDITLLFTCESGNRGWCFASTDSDYDIRFLYLRPLNSYLTLHPGRDVIELPVSNPLAIVGWGFRKALQLFQRTPAYWNG